MKLLVYKGFKKDVLSSIKETPLLLTNIEDKINPLKIDLDYTKKLRKELLEDHDERWITYIEYASIFKYIENSIKDGEINVTIINNNIYPNIYPLNFELDNSIYDEILRYNDSDKDEKLSSEAKGILNIYKEIYYVNGKYYGAFSNYENDNKNLYTLIDFYKDKAEILDEGKHDSVISVNNDLASFIKTIDHVLKNGYKKVAVHKTSNTLISNTILESLKSFAFANGISLYKYVELSVENEDKINEFASIVKDVLRIPGFKDASSFRKLKFYKSPDISNELTDLSQSSLILDIVEQAEIAFKDNDPNYKGDKARDIFITAPTGAGKSLIFQTAAVYLAQKYKKLTVIIEPIIALMQDQKDALIKRGFDRVEVFNSQLITQEEKEVVLNKVKKGEVDILYLSPETILSYSIDTLIGDREIGLFIIDEAHIVNAWGIGFRPDYWYLGAYINKVRNIIKVGSYKKENAKPYFPICAFTATAVYGGLDDSVNSTEDSLCMFNPIEHIGYIKRDNIIFNINVHTGPKLSNPEYEKEKGELLSKNIENWIANKEKTICYFPYASHVNSMLNGLKNFAGITIDKKQVGSYVGSGHNLYSGNGEAEVAQRKDCMEKFKNGTYTVMLATKAFGMGIDIDDITNVYHYAFTGNLCDYIQEIGRSARKTGSTGYALMDFYQNDTTYINKLFGMSQIKQFQVNKVLEVLYNTYLSKGNNRSFMISPSVFSFLFPGSEDNTTNKVKTCLMMLENDFYDKETFKVLVSRPQSIFTKAFVVVNREHQDEVLKSEYGQFFKFFSKGRFEEPYYDAFGRFQGKISDTGDIYLLDLKSIWELKYPNISFAHFKHKFYSRELEKGGSFSVLPSILGFIGTRQLLKVNTKKDPSTNKDYQLRDLRVKVLDDIGYVCDAILNKFKHTYFSINDFANLISPKYGHNKAVVIANSIFDIYDPKHESIKVRLNTNTNVSTYFISNGTIKSKMKKCIYNSGLVTDFCNATGTEIQRFSSLFKTDSSDALALKMLSIFDYINYETTGGENPEVYVRINDPEKIRKIVMHEKPYKNNYVISAKEKHDRDVEVLRRFFLEIDGNDKKWNFIEDYFLGKNLVEDKSAKITKFVSMGSELNIEKSYDTNDYSDWDELKVLLPEDYSASLSALIANGIPKPEYLNTLFKKGFMPTDDIGVFSWPSKNAIVFAEDASDTAINFCRANGWFASSIYDIDIAKLKEALEK